ncbi:hypothetical protein ACQEVC_34325 [Plantactinospora sp. CA-294935]|uniref:hypothetical protein n=1 Tax=Plantactinospora sp. CA-294935 TaxID=3240012 RepID=UPI003D8B6C92
MGDTPTPDTADVIDPSAPDPNPSEVDDPADLSYVAPYAGATAVDEPAGAA